MVKFTITDDKSDTSYSHATKQIQESLCARYRYILSYNNTHFQKWLWQQEHWQVENCTDAKGDDVLAFAPPWRLAMAGYKGPNFLG